MFKINISEKSGKTYKLEAEAEELIEKSLHDKISGKDILPELEGYELEIAGASDKAGFTAMENVEGIGLKKVLLTYGKAMHTRPRREGKKKVSNPKPKGLRMRKTVRGQVISPEIIQINLKVLKEGAKKLSEIFPEQNKKEETPVENNPPTNSEDSVSGTPINKAPEPKAKSEEVPKDPAVTEQPQEAPKEEKPVEAEIAETSKEEVKEETPSQ